MTNNDDPVEDPQHVFLKGLDKKYQCHIYLRYSDRQAWANSVDPDQTSQNVASDQRLHCLSVIKQSVFSHISW